MRAAGYIRVSSDEQAASGVSLEAQRAKLEQYAQLYELQLVDVVEDAGLSAKTLDRPGLQRVLGMLRKGEADAVIVAKLDRLTRRVADLATLIEGPFQKAALLSVGEQIDTRSAAGRLVLHVLGSVAEWERATIGERTKVALQHLKAQGRRVGAIPYGYRLAGEKQLEQEPAEQEVIAIAREMRQAGMTLRAICDALTAHGYRSRTGNPFLSAQIMRMCA